MTKPMQTEENKSGAALAALLGAAGLIGGCLAAWLYAGVDPIGLILVVATAVACTAGAFGVASVLIGRSQQQLAAQLERMVAQPLGAMAPSARQEELLATLTHQGASWPKAAEAVAAVTAELSSLRTSWTAAHAKSSALTSKALEGAVSEMATGFDRSLKHSTAALDSAANRLRDAMTANAESAAVAVRDAVAPELRRVLETTTEATAKHVERIQALFERDQAERRQAAAAVSEQTETRLAELLKHIDEGVTERREAERAYASGMGEHLETLTHRIDSYLEARAQADTGHATKLTELTESISAQTNNELAERGSLAEDLHNKLTDQLQALATHLDGELAARRNLAEQLNDKLSEQLRAVTTRLDSELEARQTLEHEHLAAIADQYRQLDDREQLRAQSLAERWEAMTVRLQHALEAAADTDRQRGELLAQVAETVQGDLSATAAAVRDRLEADASAERERHEQVATYMDRLVDTTRGIGEAADKQAEAARSFAEAATQRTAEIEQHSSEHLTQLAERLSATLETHNERWDDLQRTLLEGHQASVEAAGNALATHASELTTSASNAVEAAREAADAVRAGGAEITGVAEMFAQAVDRHGEAANLWLESLGAVEAAVQEAGERAAAEALEEQLASTHELFARQLELHKELFEQLRGLRTIVAQGPAQAQPIAATDETPAQASA